MPNIVYLHSSYPKKDFGEASFFLPCILLYIQMVLREWTWSLGNSSIPFLHTCSFPLRMLYLQRGHVAFILSHFTMHVEWKWWLQGRAWSSVPSSYELRHMQHSYEKKKYIGWINHHTQSFTQISCHANALEKVIWIGCSITPYTTFKLSNPIFLFFVHAWSAITKIDILRQI